jgi:hypothetical protein
MVTRVVRDVTIVTATPSNDARSVVRRMRFARVQYRSALAHRAIGRIGCTMVESIVGARSSSTRSVVERAARRVDGTLASAATT